MVTLALAWCVLCALTARNPHMAMAMARPENRQKNNSVVLAEWDV